MDGGGGTYLGPGRGYLPWTREGVPWTREEEIPTLDRGGGTYCYVNATLRCTVNSNGLKSSGLIPILSLIALFGLITSFALSALYAD